MMTGAEIREMFLRYFAERGHRRVHSSSLVPTADPTLLFTNAGMNQFKDVFLGLESRAYNQATTAQKCLRAGGKHNDLENVGFTSRHHTFFEMLGNFSFGDYFKREAIAYAWELVTAKDWFAIPKEKLYVTIFKGESLQNGGEVPRDDDAYRFWLEQGIAKHRVYEFGMKDNFWQMGETGPCGPCSEIHYDMGAAASDQGHADCAFGCECGRYVEIWNLVFMQFDRDAGGKLTPLPKPSIDTGAGLERLAAVLQGKISNYDTDLFMPLIEKAAELTGGRFHADPSDLRKLATEFPGLPAEDRRTLVTHAVGFESSNPSLRVIADHARAATFLINDGIVPGNGTREYVLRKVIRRAVYYGRRLGQDKPFMYRMVDVVRDVMGGAYPELIQYVEHLKGVILSEEKKFARTLATGLPRLEQEFVSDAAINSIRQVVRNHYGTLEERELAEIDAEDSPGHVPRFVRASQALESAPKDEDLHLVLWLIQHSLPRTEWPKLPGRRAFHINESYGLPRDFIQEVAASKGFVLDELGFEEARAEEQARARASWKGGAGKATASPALRELKKTTFDGYRQTESEDCEVLAIIHNNHGVKELQAGERGEIVLDRTPFYAESGGQVGDTGWFYNDEHNAIIAEVHGCVMPVQGIRAHRVAAHQPLHVGQKIDAVVNTGVRTATMRNHTATHLVHAALRETLGTHVKQAGSLVDPQHLRFDFSHFTSVADEELQDIEDLVNKEVLRNTTVEVIDDVPLEVAVSEYKAMALFGEKYGERVRVIRIGDFSTELCGGTHTGHTGEVGLVKILDEGSVSSGVRRLEAVTGEASLHHFRRDHELERAVAGLVRGEASASPAEALRLELARREEEVKKLRKELDQARMKSAAAATASAEEQVRVVKGIKVLATRVDNLERAQMRTLVDNLRAKLGSGVVVLGSALESDGQKKVALIVGVTPDVATRAPAGKIIAPIAQKVGGAGGGRADMAEAGGKNPAALDAALNEAYGVVESLAK